jgi:8-oxo-dGTP diphosphatase
MDKTNPISSKIKFAVLAVDAACFRIIEGRLHVLLGRVNVHPHYVDRWGLIGAMVLPDETAEDTVERVLLDKAGIEKIYKEQLYTFSSVDRDPRGRVVAVAYLALSGNDPQTKKGKIETKWQSLDTLPSLAYDHNAIVKTALERLRTKIEYTSLAKYLLPEHFTLSDMQKVYEAVLDRGVDKRNFRKKILSLNLLKDTKLTRKDGKMRPAALYTFKSGKLEVHSR